MRKEASLDELCDSFNSLSCKYTYLPMHSLCHKSGKPCSNSTQTWLALSMLSTKGPNGIAVHDCVLRIVDMFHSASGDTPVNDKRCDLLPISPVAVEVWSRSKAHARSKGLAPLLMSLCRVVFASLNF